MATKKHTSTAQGATAVNKNTVQYQLECIADEKIRKQALDNAKAQGFLKHIPYMSTPKGAIGDGFKWSITPQEHDYWEKIYYSTIKLRPHPSEPKITVSDKL